MNVTETRSIKVERGAEALALAVAVFALLLLAPAARASSDPIGSGSVKLILTGGFRSFLRQDGLRLTATAPAQLKGTAVNLPVSAGSVDPTVSQATVEPQGALTISSSRRQVPLRDLVAKTNHTPLTAKVGGSQLKLASAATLSFKREGFDSSIAAGPLKLTIKVAERLDKKLRPKHPFREGQVIGRLSAALAPATTAILERNRATLAFGPGLVAKLEALHVSLNPVFPAEHQGATFTFPIIAGGAIAPDASQGTLRMGGEVELLQLGGGQIFWHEPWLDLGTHEYTVEANVLPSPPYAGKTGRVGAAALVPGSGSASSDPATRTISLSLAALSLSSQSASAFNQAFAQGKEEFRAGEALGSFSFAAVGQ